MYGSPYRAWTSGELIYYLNNIFNLTTLDTQNSLATRHLARFTSGFVFINLGTTISTSPQGLCCSASHTFLVIIIVLLAMTPRSEMHRASFVFGSEGIINNTDGWNTGVAFLFGLLSVQWTVSLE